jgi:hypothetical protein
LRKGRMAVSISGVPESYWVAFAAHCWAVSDELLWALTLFPRGCDQVIPQVLAVFLF